jgi:hypothetical protein
VLSRYRGIREEPPYGWQIKVLDAVPFLTGIAPALEERLAASPLRGISDELVMNLYRHRAGLRIAEGRVVLFTPEADAEADINIPPSVATQLWLGWKSLRALDGWYKDLSVKDEKRQLIDVLFPPADAHIYVGY